MGRIEARTTRPPDPALPGRESAISPREQISPARIPFQAAISLTLDELQKTTRVLPKKIAHRFGIALHVAGIASDNGIKAEDFQRNFPNLTLRRLPTVEPHLTDEHEDAKGKALSAAAKEREERSFRHPLRALRARRIPGGFWPANPITGLDILEAILEKQPDGRLAYSKVGKPEREAPGHEMELIQHRFATLASLALDNGWPSLPYLFKNKTYIRYSTREDTSRDAHSLRQMVVLLDPHVLAYIATPEGFAQYQHLAEQTYPPLVKTAGGMKIEAFQQMGAIQYITANPDELRYLRFDQTDQQKAYAKAQLLASGKMDRTLLKDYVALFPPTIPERARRARKWMTEQRDKLLRRRLFTLDSTSEVD